MTTIKVSGFNGISGDTSPIVHSPELWDTDEGGRRDTAGVWAIRRGQEHTGFAQRGEPIIGVVGFYTSGGVLSYGVVAGTSLYDDELEVGSSGYGAGGYGDGGYGR